MPVIEVVSSLMLQRENNHYKSQENSTVFMMRVLI